MRRGRHARPPATEPPDSAVSAGEPVLFCLHVPRCGGTTIERFLAHALGPRYWEVKRRRPRWPLELSGGRYADPRPPAPPHEVRALSGHWLARSLERQFAGRPIVRTVILREPKSLVMSWYNFRMAKYRFHGHNTYGFDLHLTALSPDPMAHFLLQRWLEWPWQKMLSASPREKAAALDAALSDFDFVGDTTHLNDFVADLKACLGVADVVPNVNGVEYWARLGGWHPLTQEALTQAQTERLYAYTRLDDYVWRRWAMGVDATLDPDRVAPFARHEPARLWAELARRRRRYTGVEPAASG